jgi:3-dehydroquinate dehydratase type I
VDLEEDVPAAEVAALRSQGARVMVSHHDFAGTAGRRRLHAKALALAASGPDCIKIATTCRKPGDVLKVLELIPFGQATLKTAVIAFAMGALGRWSRVACLLLGSPWSYVKLPGQPAAAPGQLTPTEVRALWKVLR